MTDEVREAADYRRLDGRRAGVLDGVGEGGGWEAGVVGLVWDEGCVGFECDLEGEFLVPEVYPAEGILAPHLAVGESRQPRGGARVEAVALRVRWLEAGLEYASVDFAPLLDGDAEEAVRHPLPLRRPVENLPVAELAASTDAHVARADAAEEERRLRRLGAETALRAHRPQRLLGVG